MNVVVISLMMSFAAIAAFMCALATVGGIQVARKFSDGILHYVFYALFLSTAVATAGWNRDYSSQAMTFVANAGLGGGLAGWGIRLTSVIAVLGCIDQLLRYWRSQPRVSGPQAALLVSFLFFWLTNTVIPANFAAHPGPFQLPWLYTLLLTPALLTLSEESVRKVLQSCRNAIVLFCAAGMAVIVVKPSMVLDYSYNLGFIPGMPRFTGFASHPVGMGLFASTAIWCLMAEPLTKKWLNRLAMACCLAALCLSQAKAAVFSFLPGVIILAYYRLRPGEGKNRRLGDFNVLYGLLFICIGTSLLGLLFYALFGNGLNSLADLLQPGNGAPVFTLTGRDKIWAIALQEWRASPVFGYGLEIFGDEYGVSIHMLNATSGHSQFYDALGRSGLVGTAGAMIYFAVLAGLGIKYARASHGLSLALAMSLVLRAVTEVSLGIRGIDIIDVSQYLLIAVLAGSIQKTRRLQRDRIDSTAAFSANPKSQTGVNK